MIQVVLTFVIVAVLLSLQFVLPSKPFATYSDQALRDKAIARAMRSVPKDYKSLLSIVNTLDNPLTIPKIKLGRELYNDTILSKSQNVSCNSCHTIKQKGENVLLGTLLGKNKTATNCVACHTMDNTGTDRLTFASGETPHPLRLNVQTIYNTAFAKYLTWNGDNITIKQHTINSIQDKVKLGLDKNEAVKRVKNSPYKQQFETIFKDGVTIDNIGKSIEAYIKTLVTRGSYDEFLDGNDSAISSEAKRGFANFINFGCKGCHTGIAVGGESVQKFPLRKYARVFDMNINYSFEKGEIIDNSLPFENKGGFVGNKNNKFKVPSLRNVTKTSPYFHNGAVFKIRDAVNIMAKHQTGKNLNDKQIDEIVEFLKTLEGQVVMYKEVYDD
jgi:cytochrome c peroxidase